MFSSKFARFLVLSLFIGLGAWVLLASTGLSPETAARQDALQSYAPAIERVNPDRPIVTSNAPVSPVKVNLRDIPARVLDPNNQFDRWQRGEIDLEKNEGIRGRAAMEEMRQNSARLAPSSSVNLATSGPELMSPSLNDGFDSMDYNDCCGGGGSVPPDPEMAASDNYVVAAVNVALEIYDTNGNSLVGPITFESFMNSDPNCVGVFDPNVNYDESADRFVVSIDADGTHYCMAVSQSGDPTGGWNIYSFPTSFARNDFFDYPHAGIGNDAIYMGSNIFGKRGFKEALIFAFDKNAMYAGQSASYVYRSLGSNDDTPQPLNLHGWNQGTWPTSGPHYILTETGYNGADYTVFAWNDPFGANTLTNVGTVDLVAATGVSAGLPVASPQNGSGTMDAGDYRPLDFEFRNGYGWTSHTIACNPGSGTVNCVRWAQIDLSNVTVADAGVYASNGEYRSYPDLAVNHCGDMAVGYTKFSSSMYPSIYYTGRQAGDAAGTLQAETLLKAGEITYTSFETSSPRRWGDYTEMTVAPDGVTFWYLGEYSKNTGNSNGRWGTYIGSFSYTCDTGGSNPTPTPGPTTVPPTPTTAPPTPTTAPPTPTSEPTGLSVSANAYKQRGQKYVDVSWAGATSGNVDIYYNGSLYTTTANDGFETIGSLGNGGGTWAIQVCEAGTSTCSSTVSGGW